MVTCVDSHLLQPAGGNEKVVEHHLFWRHVLFVADSTPSVHKVSNLEILIRAFSWGGQLLGLQRLKETCLKDLPERPWLRSPYTPRSLSASRTLSATRWPFTTSCSRPATSSSLLTSLRPFKWHGKYTVQHCRVRKKLFPDSENGEMKWCVIAAEHLPSPFSQSRNNYFNGPCLRTLSQKGLKIVACEPAPRTREHATLPNPFWDQTCSLSKKMETYAKSIKSNIFLGLASPY